MGTVKGSWIVASMRNADMTNINDLGAGLVQASIGFA